MVAASLLLPIQKAPSSKIPFIPNTSKHVAAGDCEVRPIHGEREDGYHRFDAYKEDYPSRLHYKTGAKLYKFKQGKFKTYWALGDNCALFTDRILGCLGADILSIRGIISPGTYLEWLQNEYLKKNSPIVSRTLYTLQTKKDFNV